MSDALTDILDSIRMNGSVFSRAEMTAPFGVESGSTPTGIFHAVVRGNPWIKLADSDSAEELEPGDIVLFPFGDNHLITDEPGSSHQPIGLLTSIDERGMGHLIVEGGGARTSLLCGTVAFNESAAHPLLSLLPRMVRVSDLELAQRRVVEDLIRLIAAEVDAPAPGSDILVKRFTDVLLVFVLRGYVATLEPGQGGWLGALQDPSLRAALDLIHSDPKQNWSASDLAKAAGRSRSGFFSAFKEAVGMTPGEYQTRWRLHLAAELLREHGYSVGATAREVGYGTEAAFSNAFLKFMGVRPGAYRTAA